MIFQKFKKTISIITLFAYLLGFLSVPSISYSAGNEGLTAIRIGGNDISYDNNVPQTVNHIYLDGTQISEAQLWSELQTYYNARLVGVERDTHIRIYSGDNCSATACVTVTVDYDGYSQEVERDNYYLQMSEGNPEPDSYSNFDGVSHGGGGGATNEQISRLNSLNSQIASQNSINSGIASDISSANNQLSRLQSSHASAQSQLASLEQQRNSALIRTNAAIINRNHAINERHQAKQEASNAKTEADRQAAAVSNQEQIKAQREAELARLENKSADLVSNSSNYTDQLQSNRTDIDQNIAAAQNEINQTINRHNQIADTIVGDLGITEAVDHLDIDYSDLVETPNDFEAPVLPNGAEIQTPKSHPKYNDLVDAINYHESMADMVESSSSDQVKHAYELSEIGIIQADQAYAEGNDAEGDAYLDGALTVLDSVLDFVPGVSFIKDVTSIATGVNPITGEEVSDTERALMLGALFLPAALSGTGKVVGKTAKALEKLSEKGSAKADELLESISKSEQDLSKFTHKPCNISSSTAFTQPSWNNQLVDLFNVSTFQVQANNPCNPGFVLDDLKRRFKDDQVQALADTKPGQYYEGVEAIWGKTRYRDNMKKLDDTPDLSSDIPAHHIFPKQFEEAFKNAGIWVHDPRIMAPLPKDLHTDIHAAGYNAEWSAFFRTNPDYDATVAKAKEMTEEYGFADFLKGYF